MICDIENRKNISMFTKEAIDKRLSRKELKEPILNRFLRYVKVWTTSDDEFAGKKKPSTDRQMDLINILSDELKSLKIKDIEVDQHGFLIANVPASPGFESAPCVMFCCHVDTSSACSGKDVNPIVRENYDGSPIPLADGLTLDPAKMPILKNAIHDTIIHTDGKTLLGADDKAGIANLMTALEYVLKNNKNHGPIQIMFNTDEEIGCGMDHVPLNKIKAKQAYTIDSTEMPLVEYECFNAHVMTVEFTGFSVHPGYCRGQMVNAAVMAATFISMLPRNESPEATDMYYGYFYVNDMQGDCEKAKVVVNIRDFDLDKQNERIKRLTNIAMAVESIFPGGKVKTTCREQYKNMVLTMGKDAKVVQLLHKATKNTIGSDKVEPIRGGTDGSHLTADGIPTPNLFTGGFNCHSRSETAVLSWMIASTEVIIELIDLWSKEKQ